MAETSGLLNRRWVIPSVSSNLTSSAVLKRSEKLRRMSKQRVLLALIFEQRSHVSFAKETDELVSRKIFTTVKIYSRTNLTSSAFFIKKIEKSLLLEVKVHAPHVRLFEL